LAILVIVIHSEFLQDHSDILNFYITQSAIRFSVPPFFIVGGFFFYEYLQKGGRYSDWFLSLFILHTVWSFLYLYFYIPSGSSLFVIFVEIGKKFIEGYWHLWFTIAMLCASLCLYVVRSYSDRTLFCLSLFLFVVGAFIQFSGNYHLFHGTYLDILFNKTHVYRNFLFIGFPFFTLGYLISRSKLHLALTVKSCWIFLGVSLVLLSLEGAIHTNYIGDYRQTFDILLCQYLVAPALVLLLLKSNKKTKTPLLGQISAGVYFSHPFFLLTLPAIISDRLLVFVLTVVLSIVTSFLLINLNRRLRFIL
jgi:hypothetical protein